MSYQFRTDFVPNDPRISTDPRDFNHRQPLTEEQKISASSYVSYRLYQIHLVI